MKAQLSHFGWIVLFALLSVRAQAESSTDYVSIASRFESLAKAQGFEVQRGGIGYFRAEDCLKLIQTVGTCLGNNPTSPYGLFFLPPGPGEYVFSSNGQDDRFPGMASSWQLQPQEAVVFIGRTVPQAKYLGYRSYLQTRLVDGERKTLAASLGDSINHVSLKRSGSSAFDALVGVMTTADANVEDKLSQLLVSAGVSDQAVNRDRIPVPKVRLGYGSDRDNFSMIARVAVFQDSAAGEAYMNAPPGIVFRLRPKQSLSPLPQGVPVLATRTGNDELGLEQALDGLAQGVKAFFRQRLSYSVSALGASFLVGLDCIDRNVNCFGDNNDTTYDITLNKVELTDGSAVLIGVNHTQLANAEYTNVSVYNAKYFMGIFSILDTQFRGSVDAYLPYVPAWQRAAVAAAKDQLYAVELSRACHGRPYCFEVPYGQLGINAGDGMWLVERAYVKSGTSHGPSYDALLVPQLLNFK